MRGLVEHLIVFPNEFNKLNNTGVQMKDFIYHMTQKHCDCLPKFSRPISDKSK